MFDSCHDGIIVAWIPFLSIFEHIIQMTRLLILATLSLNFLVLTNFAWAADSDTPKLRESIKPVKLDDKKKSSEDKKAQPEEVKPSPEPVEESKSSKSDVPLPARLASFTTGFVVGTPIAIARCMYKQTKAGAADLVGDKRNPVLVVPATMVSIPFAIMGGPFEGLGVAAVNSWKGSAEEPFGEDSFSLGDWE